MSFRDKVKIKKDNSGYIYLIHEREFIKCNEKIYKIGRTASLESRVSSYPKGSKLLYSCSVNNIIKIEGLIKDFFKTSFIKRDDIGLEYFEGDPDKMIELIKEIIKDNDSKQLDESCLTHICDALKAKVVTVFESYNTHVCNINGKDIEVVFPVLYLNTSHSRTEKYNIIIKHYINYVKTYNVFTSPANLMQIIDNYDSWIVNTECPIDIPNSTFCDLIKKYASKIYDNTCPRKYEF